eukprot:m.89030 g.89030  ORF g.89030 m.89030 type:complete len:300 (-) comp26254_c0_seq1:140-1039(-)
MMDDEPTKEFEADSIDADAQKKIESRSSGVVGRNFTKSTPSEEINPQDTSVTSKWWSGVTSASKTIWTDMKDNMTSKNVVRIRQQVAEMVKPQAKTVDAELAKLVETVKGARADLDNAQKLLDELTKSMKRQAQDQIALSLCLKQLADTTEDAAPMLSCQYRIQDVMSKNSVGLIEALSFLREQVKKFIAEDYVVITHQLGDYEKIRIDYDASRIHFESLKDTQSPKLPAAEATFLEAYNKLSEVRKETWSKLCKFQEKKVDLIKKEFGALMNAVSMFCNGNTSGFEDAMAKMNEDTEE